jgi:tetratricopeptide (TPR) repeat protein
LQLAKTSAAGPGTLLVNDRFRLVAEAQSLQLWANVRATPAGAAETASGVDLVRKGRLDAAVAAFGKATQLTPADAEPRLLLADALDRQGKQDEAVAALDEACRLDPGCAWVFADLARPLLARGQHARALELLGKAVRHRPQDAALRFQLGEVFARAGAPGKAVGCYAKAAELYPDHGQAWARRAEVLTALGRPEEAKRARGRAAEISPALGSPARAQLAQFLADRARKEGRGAYGSVDRIIGSQLLDESYLDEAIDHLRRATLMVTPTDSPAVLCNLGLALTRRGQYAEALGLLRRGHRLGSALANWSYPSAQWIRDAERGPELETLRQAVVEAEASFRRQLGDAATGRALADAYARLFDYPKTAREYLAPDAQVPDDPELWCNLAGMLVLGQETDLHRQLCERALKQAGRLADAGAGGEQRNAYVIARLCALAEKPPVDVARVLELARQSVDGQANAWPWHLHALGLACYRAGKYEEAVRHLNESVTKDPG